MIATSSNLTVRVFFQNPLLIDSHIKKRTIIVVREEVDGIFIEISIRLGRMYSPAISQRVAELNYQLSEFSNEIIHSIEAGPEGNTAIVNENVVKKLDASIKKMGKKILLGSLMLLFGIIALLILMPLSVVEYETIKGIFGPLAAFLIIAGAALLILNLFYQRDIRRYLVALSPRIV
jgi:hypothetical protein